MGHLKYPKILGRRIIFHIAMLQPAVAIATYVTGIMRLRFYKVPL